MADIEITPSLVKAAAHRIGGVAAGIAGVARAMGDAQGGGTAASGFLVDDAITFLNGRWGVTTGKLAEGADAYSLATWQAADAHTRLAGIQVDLAGAITKAVDQ